MRGGRGRCRRWCTSGGRARASPRRRCRRRCARSARSPAARRPGPAPRTRSVVAATGCDLGRVEDAGVGAGEDQGRGPRRLQLTTRHGRRRVSGGRVGRVGRVRRARHRRGVGCPGGCGVSGCGGREGGVTDRGRCRCRRWSGASSPSAGAAAWWRVVGGVRSARMSSVVAARSQCRSSGRRRVCAASIRDSSSSMAARTAAGAASGVGVQAVWRAWAHSCTNSPHAVG